MAGEQRPWPTQVMPRRRLGPAGLHDLVLILPLALAAAVAGVLVGRFLALPLLAAAFLIRPTLIVATGTTPGLRRQGIRLVQAGDRSPTWWRPFAWQSLPFVLLAPIWLLSGTGLWLLGFVPYIAVHVVGWWRGRARGPGSDPLLALAGLDAAWAGEPPTPNGTSGPPAPAPPAPTPAAPATPGPAPRRG